MTPSNDCLNIIETSEGCKLTAYQDTGGVWTIGYGHTLNVRPHQTITLSQAASLLDADIQYAVKIVNDHCMPCTQSQFDALVDFVFNVGPSQFLSSHLFAYHVSREYEKAAAEFPKWKYDNGKVEPGLVTRRANEQALYTRQEQSTNHPHTDEQGHSASPVLVPDQVRDVVLPSQVPPAPASSTAPASGTGPSVFLSQAGALIRRLLGKG